jgi:hypothetical protein
MSLAFRLKWAISWANDLSVAARGCSGSSPLGDLGQRRFSGEVIIAKDLKEF